MKKQLSSAILLVAIAMALVLAGCQPAPTATAVPPPAKVATEAPKPTAAPTAAPALDLASLIDKYISSIPDGFYGMKAADVADQLKVAKPFLLDVREASEITSGGTIEGAVNIPLRTLTKNLDKLPAQDAPIIVFCGVSYRGAIAMEALQLLGYSNVKSLSGGFSNGWKAANLPTVAEGAKPTAGTAPKVDAQLLAILDKYIAGIPDGFYGMKAADVADQLKVAKPFLLDVREASEVTSSGTIEGAVNIPLRTLTKNLDKLPAQDAPIIVFCGVSYRGAIAMEALQLLGYSNVKNISGGFTNGWVAANLPVVK